MCLDSLLRLRANKLLLEMYRSTTAALGQNRGVQFVCLCSSLVDLFLFLGVFVCVFDSLMRTILAHS